MSSKTEVWLLEAITMWDYEKQNTKMEYPQPDSNLDFGNSNPRHSLYWLNSLQ